IETLGNGFKNFFAVATNTNGTVNSTGVVIAVQAAAVPAPTISGASPNSGAPGTIVTVTGTNFVNVSAFKLNGASIPSARYTVVNTTTITFTLAAGDTSGVISVTTPSGTATSTGVFTVTAPVTNGYHMTFDGNSNHEERGGDSSPRRTFNAVAGLIDVTYSNVGVGGSTIDTMLNSFATRITANLVDGRDNVVIGMEGTNSFRSGMSAATFVTKVKQWCSLAKADSRVGKVFWKSSLPYTAVPGYGGSATDNARAVAANAILAVELPAMGVKYIDLANGKTLIGNFGTADWGNDANYSTYLPVGAPTAQYPSGTLVGVNRFYNDDPPTYRIHLSNHGFDVDGIVTADYMLNYALGTPLPDRSQYGAVQPSARIDMDWVNLAGLIAQTGRRVQGTGNSSFSGGANGRKSLGATPDYYKGSLRTIIRATGMFAGVNDANSGPSFGDMKVGLFTEGNNSLQRYLAGNPLGGGSIGQFDPQLGLEVEFRVYADHVQCWLPNGTAEAGRWNVVMNYPCWLDVSLSTTSNYADLPTIEGPNIVDTPIF
ncbi:MAG TPA: hypothetical protein VF690_11945, partial [Hymenobacter sp.]